MIKSKEIEIKGNCPKCGAEGMTKTKEFKINFYDEVDCEQCGLFKLTLRPK